MSLFGVKRISFWKGFIEILPKAPTEPSPDRPLGVRTIFIQMALFVTLRAEHKKFSTDLVSYLPINLICYTISTNSFNWQKNCIPVEVADRTGRDGLNPSNWRLGLLQEYGDDEVDKRKGGRQLIFYKDSFAVR